MRAARAVALLLALTGCAEDIPTAPAPVNPRAAYSAARIAEGAYLASGHVNPRVLAKLVALDRRARTALENWQAAPDLYSTRVATVAVADLADCLVHEAQF